MDNEVLDYRFDEMEATNAGVRARLAEFTTTLEDFKRTYAELADAWGGVAATNAGDVAVRLDTFGKRTAQLVGDFLKELVRHLEQSQATETANKNLFAN